MPKILVCVSDTQLFLLLRHVLAHQGFNVVLVIQPDEVLHLRAQAPIAAALIDWSQGTTDSVRFLAVVRSVVPACAVILISRGTRKGDVALPACDLLLERPFNPDILLQFLRRLRHLHLAANRTGLPGPVLRFADLEMNLATVTVHRAGKQVALTALQFRLLRRLLQAPSVVCQRDDLIESCWPAHVEVEPRTVDIHIGHIRRALEGFGPDMIRTVRGCGYALQMPSSYTILRTSNS
jgi:two-component system, OmpR family, phosphate regulon response regulator PhoB